MARALFLVLAVAALSVHGEGVEEDDMVTPLPVNNKHFMDYVTMLIDEYAPDSATNPDPANEGNDPAFGGVLAKAKRDATAIEAQAEQDAKDAAAASAAVKQAEQEKKQQKAQEKPKESKAQEKPKESKAQE